MIKLSEKFELDRYALHARLVREDDKIPNSEHANN